MTKQILPLLAWEYNFTLMKALLGILVIVTAFFTLSCSNENALSEENIEKALESYFSENPATFQVSAVFPSTFRKGDYQVKQLDSLVEAGFLSVTDTEVKAKGLAAVSGNKKESARAYALTSLGEKHLHSQDEGSGGFGKSSLFKYADYKVQSIENWTEPSETQGAIVSRVTYTYKAVNALGAFTQSPAIQKAFPFIPKALEETQKGEQAIVKTGKGWIVEK